MSAWLDFKIGFRMLARYPGLTLVGSVAIAVAIALGALYLEGLDQWQHPRLPVPGADRVVSIRQWDAGRVGPEGRSLFDFATWRNDVRTVDQLGVAIPFVRNLETSDGSIEPVRGAELTAGAFRLLGTPPLLGRTLLPQDEQPSEPPVVVISHAIWTTRFASDPGVVGRAVRLGATTATVVGVMPAGFGFPSRQRVWAPVRVDGSVLAPRTGPAVSIFGRLAEGVTMAEAQAEFDLVASRMASSHPGTHRDLRLRVTHFGAPLTAGGEALVIRNVLYSLNGVFLALLAIMCANVAALVFARTATRSWEIAVRSALGAGRGRIISQLFIEALVLAGLAAAVGLVVAKVALSVGVALMARGDAMPFWITDSLSWKTILYAALLTVVGAAIIGVLPALRVTRASLHDAMRRQSAGSGLRFGGFWTTVIVVQVAITVVFLPLAAGGVFQSNRFRQRAEGIGADRFLIAAVDMDREEHTADSAVFAARARLRFDELLRRLSAEPGVDGVAFADRVPVMDQFKYRIEVDTSNGAPASGLGASTLVHVSGDYFASFGTSLVAGREFSPVDFERGRVLIVNESFARNAFAGRGPIGQRVRILDGEDMAGIAGGEWYEVIGMVRDFGWQLPSPTEQSAMYHPTRPLPGARVNVVVRHREPEGFAARLRVVAATVDPGIRLTDVRRLSDAGGGEAQMNWVLTAVAGLVSFIVLLLSATGVHSLMSFTVARRTREIGVRAALGALPRSIVRGIFGRAFLQVSAGIAAGSALTFLLGFNSGRQLMLLLAADGVMLAAGLTACAVPLRRALRIDPTEALRAEA